MPRFRHWLFGESGVSTAAMTVLLLPVIFGIFGLGFEVARATYLKTWLQGRVDNAAFTASATTGVSNTNGRFFLLQDALGVAYENYQVNTADRRATGLLSCSASSVSGGNTNTANACAGRTCFVRNPNITSTTPGPCYATTSPVPAGTDLCNYDYGVRYTVKEEVPSTFLRILGIEKISLPAIVGESLVKPRTC